MVININSGMSLNFQFATASQIIFGKQSIEKVPELISEISGNILLVTGNNAERANILTDKLSAKNQVFIFKVKSEPTIEVINEGVKIARENNCRLVTGFGGGSAVDAAKAIAALVPNQGGLMDYLEVIGKGKALVEKPLPVIAIPTTSGTGAEVTKNSVIKSEEHLVKVSLRSDLMYPDYAVVDPNLMISMPPEVTASSGVDALTHLMETFVSNQSNPFIDLFCREGMKRIASSLERAYTDGNDLEARENMALASLLGGMALANVKLGAVHGFAGPLGGMFPAPHGTVCARFLPAVMEMNFRVMSEQKADIEKYHEIARILTRKETAVAQEGIDWVKSVIHKLEIPSLSHFGITIKSYPEIVQKAKKASSMKGNPVALNDDQLMWVLENSV